MESQEKLDDKFNETNTEGLQTLLIVEDNVELINYLKKELSNDYKVLTANNGKKGLELTHKALPDIIITDVIMPEMNGQELANKITEFLPDLKIIFVSGYTFEHLIKDGEVEESINFLHKPYTIQNILRKIRETLDN